MRFVIKKTTFILTLTFMLLFLPDFFQRNRIIRNIYLVIGSAISIVFGVKSILYRKKRDYKYSINFLLEVIFFYAVLLGSTIYNSGPINAYLAHTIIGVGTCSIVMDSIYKKRIRETLTALIVSLEIYVTLNLVSILLYPNGLYIIHNYTGTTYNAAYILGHRNNSIEYCIPLAGFNILLNLYQNKKYTLNQIYCLIISTATVLLTWSVNAIICMFFLVGLDLYIVTKEKSILISVKKLFFMSVMSSIMIIIYNVQLRFAGFLEKYLHRNTTFSSRTRIWAKSITAIINKLSFGYGVEEGAIKFLRIGHPNSCHNYFLDFLYYGGVILMIDVSMMIVTISNRLKDLNDLVKTRIAVIYGSYFILWIASPIHRNSLFIMYTVFMASICIPWEKIKTG